MAAWLTRLLLTMLAVVVTGDTLATEVYVWTDKNGQRHFGDRPPDDDAERIEFDTPHRDGTAVRKRIEHTQKLLDAYARERKERETARERTRVAAREREQGCDRARARRHEFTHSPRVLRLDDQGEWYSLEGDAYDDALARHDAAVEHWCGSP